MFTPYPFLSPNESPPEDGMLPLTDTERLILANQYEILSLLRSEDPEGPNSYAALSDHLRDGHAWLYQQHPDLSPEPVLPEDDANFVLSAFDLYEDLQFSVSRLDDPSQFKAADLEFPGFDRNEETPFYNFACALRRSDRYSNVTLQDNNENSHMPTREMYDRMLEAYEEMGGPAAPFTAEQVRAILDARVHPDNR